MLEGNRVLTHTFSKKLELQINIRGCRGLLLKIEDNRGKKLLDGSGCYRRECYRREEEETRDSISFKRMSLKISRVRRLFLSQTTRNIQEREKLKFPHLRIFTLEDEIIIFDSTLSSTLINRIFLR